MLETLISFISSNSAVLQTLSSVAALGMMVVNLTAISRCIKKIEENLVYITKLYISNQAEERLDRTEVKETLEKKGRD